MKQKQHETQKLRKEGTGTWFLKGTKFIEWQDNAGALWIQGPCKPVSFWSVLNANSKIAGTGKTVLR
jgi:hypothetical protein